MRRPDKTVAEGQGWLLVACHDGERTSLHVMNDFEQTASLSAAVNEAEVYDETEGETVRLKPATLALFSRWHDQYDAFVRSAENAWTREGF